MKQLEDLIIPILGDIEPEIELYDHYGDKHHYKVLFTNGVVIASEHKDAEVAQSLFRSRLNDYLEMQNGI